jgi:hypothetical protein
MNKENKKNIHIGLYHQRTNLLNQLILLQTIMGMNILSINKMVKKNIS